MRRSEQCSKVQCINTASLRYYNVMKRALQTGALLTIHYNRSAVKFSALQISPKNPLQSQCSVVQCSADQESIRSKLKYI